MWQLRAFALFCFTWTTVPSLSPKITGTTEADVPIAPTPHKTVGPDLGETITCEVTGNTYTMGSPIGEGHFGLVYECRDVWNNELAAKVLKPLAPYEKIRASAISEFQKLIQLRHPHITYVHDAFEYDKTFYLITERCYCPLTKLIAMDQFDGFVWMKPAARCLLQAVHYIHLNQYAHQDIHLGNAFLSLAKDEMAAENPGAIMFKLGDLGIAKVFTEIDAANTRALWMLPPEVLDSSEFGPLDHRIDIYHCGLLLLNMAHGKEIRFTEDEIRTGGPRQMALQLPAPYNFALEKALRRHVAARTATAMELWRDLNSPASPAQPQAVQLPLTANRQHEPTTEGG